MENMRRWINYDWFKLVVALILLVIFILLLFQNSQSVKGASISTPVVMASTPLEPTLTASPTKLIPQPSATAAQLVQATSTPAPTSTPTLAPTTTPTQSPTSTSAAQATPTPTLQPTATAQPEQPTPTVPPTVQTASGDCSKALPTRLEVGKKAKVVTNLYFRQEPGMDKTILKTNLPGTQLEVIGGPACIPYGEGVYRWWNLKTTTGETGWSAEGSLLSNYYFLDPLP